MADRETPATPRVRDVALATGIAALALALAVANKSNPPVPEYDAMFYIQYALGISEFGVFGLFTVRDLAPPPSFVAGPLYPAFLALLLESDASMRDGLICLLQNTAGAESCRLRHETLLVVQTAAMVVFLTAVWLIAFLLSGRRLVAWLAMGFALLSGYPLQFAQLYLTEALTLPLYALFTLFLLLSYQRPQVRLWPLLAGLALGLLALNKPTYAYLFWFLFVCGAGLLWVARIRQHLAPALLFFALSYAFVTLPWVARNHHLFEQASLTGNYGERALCHRLGYNRMSTAELAVGFVYWFRWGGEELAAALFPKTLYSRFADEAHTFTRIGDEEICVAALEASGGQEARLGYLLKNEVLGNPVKHSLVTMLLAWRGMFIGKRFWWGLLGWALLTLLVVRGVRRREWAYPLLCLPAGFLVIFHGAVSISAMRYHITLAPVLAYALAFGIVQIIDRVGKPGRSAADRSTG